MDEIRITAEPVAWLVGINPDHSDVTHRRLYADEDGNLYAKVERDRCYAIPLDDMTKFLDEWVVCDNDESGKWLSIFALQVA